jgi:hypothetical protein
MDCPNSGAPLLRWPYFQYLAMPGQTYGHCAWCMKSFLMGQDVPVHKSEGLEEALPGRHFEEVG